MYYNGKKGRHVSSFLNEVHQIMIQKYADIDTIDKQNALILQNFLNNLKNEAKNYNPEKGNLIEDMAIRQTLNNLVLLNGEKINNLFRQRQKGAGFTFERELAAVMAKVMSEVSGENIKAGTLLLGQQTANVDIQNYSEKLIQQGLKEVGTKTQKSIEKSNGKFSKQYYLQDVYGKIDVKGYEVEVKLDANPQLVQIYNIIKDATISAKNYKSKKYIKDIGNFIEVGNRKNIHLGATNVYRSLYGVFSDLGYDSLTTQSAIMAALNRINDNDENVSNHIYHLRYIYELIGSGLKYNGQSFGNVKYIIFNDPDTDNIYVQATSSILKEVLNEVYSHSDLKTSIIIPKSKFIN